MQEPLSHLKKPKVYPQEPYNRIYISKEISKQYLDNDQKDLEILGPFDLTSDEYYKCYSKAQVKFLEEAKAYNRMNVLTWNSSRKGVSEKYFPCGVLDNVLVQAHGCRSEKIDYTYNEEDIGKNGQILRRRTRRKANEVPYVDISEHKSYSAWFTRYRELRRFKGAVMRIIYYRRMMQNLEKLKQVTPEKICEYEKQYTKFHNVSYSKLFAKYIL